MKPKYRKQYTASEVKALGARQVESKISTQTPDRVGDVVIAQGCDYKEYLENPIVLFGHNNADPVGNCLNLRKQDNAIYAVTQFPERPDDYDEKETWRPSVVWGLLKSGIVKGFSIGFNPTERPRMATKADKERYGESSSVIISRWKLLEYSVVPIPENQEALLTAIGKGTVTAKELKDCDIEVAAERVKSAERQNRRRKVCFFEVSQPRRKKKLDIESIVKRELHKAAGGL